MLTSGSPMSSIADGSFTNVAVFGMGFGTGADVDYTTIAGIVAKVASRCSQPSFPRGECGNHRQVYSDSLAAAMGFTTVIDPVLELFAGEHAHVDFHATSAEDSFLITAQGLDFNDENWPSTCTGPMDRWCTEIPNISTEWRLQTSLLRARCDGHAGQRPAQPRPESKQHG